MIQYPQLLHTLHYSLVVCSVQFYFTYHVATLPTLLSVSHVTQICSLVLCFTESACCFSARHAVEKSGQIQ